LNKVSPLETPHPVKTREGFLPGHCLKARSNRNDPAAVKEPQNPHLDNAVIGLRFCNLFQLTVSPRFIVFFRQWPGSGAAANAPAPALASLARVPIIHSLIHHSSFISPLAKCALAMYFISV